MTGAIAGKAALDLPLGKWALILRDVTPGDVAAVLTLHTLVFGSDVDALWFDWKYGQALGRGGGQAVGLWHGAQLIAYCGGLPRPLWRQGQPLSGLQIGDVMVHPQWRGIYARHGPFFQVSRRFYQSRLGMASEQPFQLGYGFPNERHLRLAVLLGLLRDGGVIEALRWDTSLPLAQSLPWLWKCRELAPTDRAFDLSVNTAWESMKVASDDLTLGQRDATYVRWRYVDRPNDASVPNKAAPRYRFFALRRVFAGSCQGLAVLDLRSNSAHWLDWIGPTELMVLANRACCQQAARCGASSLTAWASPAVAQVLKDSDIQSREVCAHLGIPSHSALDPQTLPDLQFWLMGGDTDFL
jgi:hypothetical protein